MLSLKYWFFLTIISYSADLSCAVPFKADRINEEQDSPIHLDIAPAL